MNDAARLAHNLKYHGQDPVGLEGVARLVRSVWRSPKTRLSMTIVTAADEGYFVPVQLLFQSILNSHDCRIVVMDLGLNTEQRRWVDGQKIERREVDLESLTVPTGVPWWQTWNKVNYIRQVGGRVLWLDADTIVTGPLDWIEDAIQHRPFVTMCFGALAAFGWDWGVRHLANVKRLYARHPVKQRMNTMPNAGVVAFDCDRDAAILEKWEWMVGVAAKDTKLRKWLKFWDQGSLQWAFEATGNHNIVGADRRFNDPSINGPHTPDELAAKIEMAGPTRILHFPAGRKPYGSFPASIDHPDPWKNFGLRLFVLGHDRDRLATCATGPHIQHVYLPDLDRDNDLAESRFFHRWVLDHESRFVGLCSSSWDNKYAGYCMPIGKLHLLHLEPNVVWAADKSPMTWIEDTEKDHEGMAAILESLMSAIGMTAADECEVPWSNNFVASRNVVEGLMQFHRKWWPWIVAKYGPRPEYDMDDFDRTRHGSYLAERLSMLYFCSRSDLEIKQIPF